MKDSAMIAYRIGWPVLFIGGLHNFSFILLHPPVFDRSATLKGF